MTFLVNVWVGGRPAVEELSEEERSGMGGPGGPPLEFNQISEAQVVEVGESNLAGEGIQLPFVMEDDGDGGEAGLVLAMPSLPGKATCSNVIFRFEEGFQPMLVHVGDEEDDGIDGIDEEDEEDDSMHIDA